MMDILNSVGPFVPSTEQVLFAGQVLQRVGAVLVSIGSLIIVLL